MGALQRAGDGGAACAAGQLIPHQVGFQQGTAGTHLCGHPVQAGKVIVDQRLAADGQSLAVSTELIRTFAIAHGAELVLTILEHLFGHDAGVQLHQIVGLEVGGVRLNSQRAPGLHLFLVATGKGFVCRVQEQVGQVGGRVERTLNDITDTHQANIRAAEAAHGLQILGGHLAGAHPLVLAAQFGGLLDGAAAGVNAFLETAQQGIPAIARHLDPGGMASGDR